MEVVTNSDSILENRLIYLMEQYEKDLLRMCSVYLRDRSLAEDAVQETFLKAYQSWDRFRNECDAKTWLMRIAINTCRDYRRSAWFRHMDRRITPEELPPAVVPIEEPHVELTLAIMRLPLHLKEVTILHYYQDMTTREIADTLNIAQSTVSTRLNRARTKLRTLLERGESL